MTKHFKRPLSVLLAVLMIAGIFVTVPMTASAWDDNPYAELVNTTTTVKFNGLDWYVIEDNSTAVNAGTITLLAKDPFCAKQFDASSSAYSTSAVKTYLDGLTTGTGSFADVANAIKTVQVKGSDSDSAVDAKLYLLSVAEATPLKTTILKCAQAEGATINRWWLRTPNGNDVAFVGGDNSVIRASGAGVTSMYEVRPALQLDLSAVNLSAVRLSGGTGATVSGGSISQYYFEVGSTQNAMTTVTYTAKTDCMFPATSEYYTTTNGITVTRTSDTVVTVSGTPEGVANIVVPNAKKPQIITASDVTVAYGAVGKCVVGTTNGEGGITYTVKSGNAVTVNETSGELTTRNVGTAVITITAAETSACLKATKDVTVTVTAEQTQPDPSSGAYADLVNTTTSVKFNGIAWYIIKDDSTAVDAGTVTLLAKDPIGVSAFNENQSDGNAYSGSTVEAYLNSLTSAGGSFEAVKDAIIDSKLNLLSLDEANAIKNANIYLLECISPAGTTSNLNYYWLSNPGNSNNSAVYVGGDHGAIKADGASVDKVFGVRPVLKLDLSKVTFSTVSVNITGGANATTRGGSASQKFFESDSTTHSAIVPVTYTAGVCCTFPATSEYYTTTNGITVERIDDKTVKVSGTPTTDDVNISVPNAIPDHDLHCYATGATITAYCPTAKCPMRENKTPAIMTIVAPTTSSEATLTDLEAFNIATGLSVSTNDIKYYKATKNGDEYTKGEALTAAPTAAGDYVAEITVSGVKNRDDEPNQSVTASVGYTIEKDAADTAAANTVSESINALPDADKVTTADKDAIEAARKAYDDLTDDQKAKVDAETLKKLTDAETALAAAEVTKQITDLPEEIKLSDKTDVEAARSAYDALTDAQKALVSDTTLKKLTDAEDAIAAAEVTKKINDLPEEIKLSDKTDVEAARAAYDALTDAQKALVTADTLKVLTDAEDVIAAAEVTKKINDLPETITDENQTDVGAARTAYDALTDAQKALVSDTTLKKLTDAEAVIADYTAANAVTESINALPSTDNIVAGDKNDIEAARAAYNALTDKQKALVSADTLAKLTEAEGKLADEIADKEEADKVTGQINDLPVNVNLKDKETVEAVRAAYDALTDNQKTYVTKEAKNKLTAAEKRIADQKAASIVIFKINTLPSEITLDSKTQIEATRAAYNALTADQKKWVDAVYVKKLTDAEDALAKIVADQQAANDVTTLINALPETIALTDKTNVEAARAAYNALTDDQKAYVSADTLKKLTDAEAALAVVVADKAAADDVATLINALPAKADVTLDDQANIEAARSAYSALSYNQKGYIDTTTYAKLTGAEAGLAAVKADKKAADDVAALINALPTEVTLNDQTDIEAARAAYGALTDNQKAFIDEPTLKKLTDAEAALSLLIDDKTAADNVINKINALPAKADVTLDDQTNIEAARAAFNALSVAQKGYVDAETQTKLADAEAGLAAVKADKKAADDVAALIEALPAKADVTLNDKDNIEAARAAYDALTDKQKAFVDAETLTKLTDAEAGLAAVNADKKAADDVKALIDALPTNVVTTDKDNIEAARAAYNALTDSQKAFVDADTLTKLTDAEAALAQAFIDKGAADGVTDLINALPTENLSIDNRDQIKQAREAYDALTDAQKYYVTEETLKKLTDVEDAFAPIEKLYNDQKAALNVEYMIDDLPDTITAADKEDVEAARAAYNELTDDQKKWVEKPFLDKLVAAEDALAAADVTAMINALPENITLDDKDDVEAARAAFNGLSFDQKGYITPATQTKLSSAEAVIAKLVADKNAADAVTKKITDLPETITLNDKNDVEAARSAYNALTDDQKALITGDTLTKLTDAEAALATVLADKEAADDVISKINALPAKDDVTLDDETDITAARAAFNGLSVAQKGYVDAATQTKLTDAEAGLAAVKADKKAADDVKAMIDALPETITLNDKTDVEAARKAYDDLTDKQKAFVDDDTLTKLTDAEKAIEVEKVKEMINNLPAEVTLDNVNDVVATSEAYENLTDAQRAKIDANAVKKLVTAANAAVKILADYKEAEKVANQINALPENISVVNKDAVVAAREAYNALTDDQKAMIDEATYNKLTDAEAAMDDPYYLIGDVDGNGTVNINDATAIQKYLAGLLELDETQIKCADTNADGNVTIGDATMIQKYISGLVDHLG